MLYGEELEMYNLRKENNELAVKALQNLNIPFLQRHAGWRIGVGDNVVTWKEYDIIDVGVYERTFILRSFVQYLTIRCGWSLLYIYIQAYRPEYVPMAKQVANEIQRLSPNKKVKVDL